MNNGSSDPRVAPLRPLDPSRAPAAGGSLRARLVGVEQDGRLRVRTTDDVELACDWLECNATAHLRLEVGEELLVIVPAGATTGVIAGRIGRYPGARVAPHVLVEAAETLTLKCGEASLDLRSDGKLMVKGEDVLVKARGTQRIKAGTVNIN